jgi:glycosyltransferase involved in cell wall biosynthesis
MKKIWLITYNLDGVTAGPSVRFQRYASFFTKKGYRLVFVTFKSNPDLPNTESREFYDVIRVSSKSRVFHHTLFIAKCLLKALFSKEKPFSILTFSLTTFHLWFLPLLKIANLKLIFVNTMSLHTTYLKGNSAPINFYNAIHRSLYSLLFKNLHAIVNSSNALTDSFRRLNIPDSKLKVIYNGVNNQRFKPVSDTEKQAFRERLDLPKIGKLVLFVGLKVDRKGILDLMESWRLIYKDHPDYYLVLVGDEKTSAGDPDYNSQWDLIKKEIENPDLRIINRPNHPQIEEYFFSSDIFIFLSKKEGMPNVVLEAMAAGLPMIITEFEGFSNDYGENGENYILVERNPKVISEAVVKLNTDKDFYNSIRNKSLQHVQDNFLVEASIDKYIQLFESKI